MASERGPTLKWRRYTVLGERDSLRNPTNPLSEHSSFRYRRYVNGQPPSTLMSKVTCMFSSRSLADMRVKNMSGILRYLRALSFIALAWVIFSSGIGCSSSVDSPSASARLAEELDQIRLSQREGWGGPGLPVTSREAEPGSGRWRPGLRCRSIVDSFAIKLRYRFGS